MKRRTPLYALYAADAISIPLGILLGSAAVGAQFSPASAVRYTALSLGLVSAVT